MPSRIMLRNSESFYPSDIAPTDTLSSLSARRGGLLVYLSSVLSQLVRELARHSKDEPQCALCPDLIHPTQPATQDRKEAWVHAKCLEMAERKRALVLSLEFHANACPVCGQKVFPSGTYFHEAGLTLSFTCGDQTHDEPYFFSVSITTNEAKQVGRWEARLRERLKDKGYAHCCECGRQIRAAKAQSLGSGWYYCGCLPELWRSGP